MQTEPINFNDTQTAFAYKSTKELKLSHFVFSTMGRPWMAATGTRLTSFALRARLPIKGLIKGTLFSQFCGGESIEDCRKTIDALASENVHTILDYSVEGLKNEEGYEDVKKESLRVVEFAEKNKNIPFCILKLSGLGPTSIMTKAQNDEPLTEMEKTRLFHCEQRVDEVISKVSEKGLMLMIDAEESWFQHFIDGVAYRMMERYNKERPVVFNTYQMYQHDMLRRLQQAIKKAKEANFHLGAKLVRGAYMEKERERAKEKNYPSPIHKNKEGVDKDYDEALKLCMLNIEKMGVCVGTHNEASCNKMVRMMEEQGISSDDDRIYFAQLLGMSDNISFKLADLKYNVAKYVPYGPVEKVLPYLFRRAEENTSIAGQSSRELSLVEKEIKRRKQQI
ncbi:MAG: proline dehydrogenase family protein [Ekhidna sp.]|nr:proline dehydrogenase family protein [Ekhidna sp.]